MPAVLGHRDDELGVQTHALQALKINVSHKALSSGARVPRGLFMANLVMDSGEDSGACTGPSTPTSERTTPPSSCSSSVPDDGKYWPLLLPPPPPPPSSSAVTLDWSSGGCPMIKVTSKKVQSRLFFFDDKKGQLLWESRKWGLRRLATEEIKEIRYKDRGRMYREQRGLGADCENLWISLIYNVDSRLKSLHIIAPSMRDFMGFKQHLECMRHYRRQLLQSVALPHFAQSAFVGFAWSDLQNKKSNILLEDVVEALRNLGISASRRAIANAYKNVTSSASLSEEGLRQIIDLVLHRREIVMLAKEMLGGKSTMTLCDLSSKVRATQGEELDLGEASEESDWGPELQLSDIVAFLQRSRHYRQSARNPDNMNEPLWNYFVSSSHNTYLLGSQLSGESTVEGYIRALESGCRSVELDCYDGSDGRAIIRHGNSLTTSISFEVVIKAISEYAFVASPYPLILSIEVHASLEQQEQMAQCLRKELGAKLLDEPLSHCQSDMPSPQDLMYKILIKGKDKSKAKNSMVEESIDLDLHESDALSSTTSESELSLESMPASVHKIGMSSRQVVSTEKLSASLARLMIYTIGCKYRGLNKKEQYDSNQIISFSERTCNKVLKMSGLREMIKHTRHHLVRVYPSAYRVTSKNLNPQAYWRAGIQLVALNWQTWDLGMQMNSALFDVAGHFGYVKKPAYLSRNKGQDMAKNRYTLDLDLISSVLLSRPRSQDDFTTTRVDLTLFAPDGPETKCKSKSVSNEIHHPIWNEKFEFKWTGHDLHLVFLSLDVIEDDRCTASCCFSLASLQPGYRHLPLRDSIGEPILGSFLFIKSGIESLP